MKKDHLQPKSKHQGMTRRYLAHAKKLMQKGDYLQASEKLWGAAAQAVKAYGEKHRFKHDGHGKLFWIVNRIAQQTGDEELQRLFQVANSLHTNFYENWQTKEQVKSGAKDVEAFIQKIEKLLDNEKP